MHNGGSNKVAVQGDMKQLVFGVSYALLELVACWGHIMLLIDLEEVWI